MSKEVENMIERAAALATAEQHTYVTLEHLLLSLLHEQPITELLGGIGVQPSKIKADVVAHLSGTDLKHPTPVAPRRTATVQRTMQRAMTQMMFSGQTELTNVACLISILSEEKSHAYYFLARHGVTRAKLIELLRKTTDNATQSQQGKTPLDTYCVNLNEMAAKGKIDPVIGRDREISDTIEILARRKKQNVLYVGNAGVGKTSLAEGLALKIVNKEVPDALHNKVVYSLDLGSMVAGTKFRGDFEERIKNVLEQIKQLGNVILFIDEIHMVMGAGSTSSNQMDASNLLKPMLANGQLTCIGATTYDEYHEHFEKDKALVRRFQKYDIDQPSAAQTKQILAGVVKHYEKFHGVIYEVGTTDACVDLADRYMKSKYFPDKAFDIMDAAGAKAKLLKHKTVDMPVVLEMASKLSRVPATMMDLKDNTLLTNLAPRIKDKVYGQDAAVDIIAEAIFMSKAGLRKVGKPVGNFLFTGPTGCGKTYLAEKLAETMGMHFQRFDMSEYMEKHTVSKFIGAPPGYVGHGEGKAGEGQLIQAIEANPNCVLLLDEVEKANPDVLTVLLQVMDAGRLTSSKGKTVDFSNVVLIMTANLGAADAERLKIGFGNQDNSAAVEAEIKKFFSPEFRNRLDAVVKFNKLTMAEMTMIVSAEVDKTEKMLSSKNITIHVTHAARELLAATGYDPKMGARPFERMFEDKVKKKLSKEILFGGLVDGGLATIDVVNGDIVVNISHLVPDTLNAT